METFELILFLLTAVIASSILDKFLPPLSLPLVQIALGAALALAVPTPLEWGIDPELLLILFIAPLHFNESRHADSGALWKSRWGIFSLAVGLVFVTVVAVGFALHALLPAIPLAAAGTYYFHWPVVVVYACTCVDEVGKLPWVLHHFRKYKWVKDLTH